MKTITTHNRIIEALSQQKLLRVYIYFLKFKHIYSSSRVHNGNRTKIARETGVSEKTVRTMVNKMLKLGWIRVEDNGDFVFITYRKFYRKYKLPFFQKRYRSTVQIDVKETVKSIETKLASILVEANLHRQKYMTSLKRNIRNMQVEDIELGGKDRKLYQKYQEKSDKLRNYTCDSSVTTLSCSGFGRLLGKSKSSGRRLKNALIDSGVIKAKEIIRRITIAQMNNESLSDFNFRISQICHRNGLKKYRLFIQDDCVCIRMTDEIEMARPISTTILNC